MLQMTGAWEDRGILGVWGWVGGCLGGGEGGMISGVMGSKARAPRVVAARARAWMIRGAARTWRVM